jgi:hypothetical protein
VGDKVVWDFWQWEFDLHIVLLVFKNRL